MKILHICNGFAGSKVHSNLVKSLDKRNVSQIVYCPVREENLLGKNQFPARSVEFIYSYCIKAHHKYLYHIKKKALYNNLIDNVKIQDVDIVHAATLFSDGCLAYQLYKKYGIPYVVAVRNTDINLFLSKLPHTWLDGIQILLNAKKIFFISKGLKKKFESHYIIKGILNKIKNKLVVLPNGIDDYFLNNIVKKRREENKVLYIGDFSKNKNVVRLGKAVLRLRQEKGFEDTTLTVVGGGNCKSDEVERLIQDHSEAFKFLGKIYEKDKLCEVCRDNSIFAMVSIHETFGLVYVEALSQNLPILYTKNQGVDGLFDDHAGISVNPLSDKEILEGLRKLLSNKSFYSNKNIDFSQFSWDTIAEQYIQSYKDCLT